MRNSILAAVVLSAFAYGCTPASNNSAGAEGGVPAGGDGGVAETTLSCVAVLDCASKCEEGVASCQEGCLAKGSPAAKDGANGVSDCAQKNSCTDSACVTANCQTEVTACEKIPGGDKTPDGTTPAGTVPADLVGRWGGLTDSFEFRVDSTVSRVLMISSPVCSTDALEHGSAAIEGTTLTISYTSGKITNCDVTEPYQPRTETFTYSIETTDPAHPILKLESVPCTSSCSNRYDKR